MTTDAVNTQGALVYQYPELTVLLGPAGGDRPSTTSTFDNVYTSRVVQSASGSRLDYAELTYAVSDFLINREQPESFARMVDVRLPDASETLLHRGDYVRETVSLQSSGAESLTAQSQMRPYHFGLPLRRYDVWDPIGSSVDHIEDDIVFNPMVDDRTLFNMSSKAALVRNGRLWTHPEIGLNATSETYQEQTREEWTLRRAVEAICELLNEDEEFVRNPTFTELSVISSTAPDLRGVQIPMGTYLPQALDTLLIPHGYNWFVNYADAGTNSRPKIKVFKIGDGTGKELLLQAPDSALNLEVSNTNQLEISNGIGDSFNQVRVFGAFEEAEVTLPLYPAWPEDDDNLSADDLEKDGAYYTAGKEIVHRLWIANEAGDLDQDIQRLAQNPDIPDLSTVFRTWVPHRRTISEPLTYQGGTDNDRKDRRPIFVEYSVDSGTTWEPAKENWSIKLCPDQIGILFDGDKPPSDIVEAGDGARIRITGTILGDSRVTGFASRESFAVNGRVSEVVINRPDKFQKRHRQESGNYKSVFSDSDYNEADERDDSDAITTYAERLRDQNHYAEIDCEFRLPGWHIEYEIGDLITKIAGREISLDAAPSTAPVARYVQIVERRFENGPGGPSTVLIVDRGVQPV